MNKDEPVAWGMEKDGLIFDVICPDEHKRKEGSYTIPLYTTSQRTWVGLNGADWNDFNPLIANDVHRVAEWVEKILRERNT
jgi:hypothetical protein